MTKQATKDLARFTASVKAMRANLQADLRSGDAPKAAEAATARACDALYEILRTLDGSLA